MRMSRKTKVAIALAFVGSLNAIHNPAGAEEPALPDPQTVPRPPLPGQQTQEVSSQSPAPSYFLLRRAEAYLTSDDLAKIEKENPLQSSPHFHFRMNDALADWVLRLAKEKDTSHKNTEIAIATVNKALEELKSVTDQYAKLNLYFVAAQLFRKAGDTKDYEKYSGILEQFISSCETGKIADETQINAAVSILHARSYGIIAVDIPYQAQNLHYIYNKPSESPVTANSPSDFAKCESIWLRSTALADRLKNTSQTRRMAHRNLSLWYKLTGKSEKAEEQKQILFTLIGKHDDKLLYPSQGGCGSCVWWDDKSQMKFACGMG